MAYDPLRHPVKSWLSRGQNRRDKGRLPQDTLASNLGPVLDLSAGGMRVLCSSVPNGRQDIELYDAEKRVRLVGEVTWVRRHGLFKREAGVRFVGIDDATATALTQMSLNNRARRQMGGREAA